MARKTIEDLDRFKDTEPLMDKMYFIRTRDETITCHDNKTGSLTNIPYVKKEDRIKEEEKDKKKGKKSKSNKSNTNTTSDTSTTT